MNNDDLIKRKFNNQVNIFGICFVIIYFLGYCKILSLFLFFV